MRVIHYYVFVRSLNGSVAILDNDMNESIPIHLCLLVRDVQTTSGGHISQYLLPNRLLSSTLDILFL
jgi:hypothetical protein